MLELLNESTSSVESYKFWVFALLLVIYAVAIGAFIFFMMGGSSSFVLAPWAHLKRPFQSEKTSRPKVGYKRAYLRGDIREGEIFTGLVGGNYSLDADAKAGVGFHAYDNLQSALDHPQGGDVVLEVLLSGTVRHYSKGYVASHQRVLQVLPYQCCGGVAEHCENMPEYFGFDKKRAMVFSCSKHLRLNNGFGKLYRTFVFCRDERYILRPLSEFYSYYPELAGAGVIVAPLAGDKKFIATKM